MKKHKNMTILERWIVDKIFCKKWIFIILNFISKIYSLTRKE